MTEAPLQEWEGYVVETDGVRFLARLLDVTAGETVETEEAEIRLDSLPEAERAFVRPGAVFRWAILRDGDGGRSELAFSRETWTAEDIERAKARADDLHAGIRWE